MATTPTAMEQAFLDSIVAHPEDPTHGLILADWLEEQGDSRAELYRLTWSLLHEPDHTEFQARQFRVQSLLAAGVQPVVPRRRITRGFEFVWVPPGSFLLGSPVGEAFRDDDETQHRVTIRSGFWIGVSPVTQVEWRSVMGTNPSSFSRGGENAEEVRQLTDAELANFPVESVSFADVAEFCVRFEGRFQMPIRLPTEAEWEFACRGGTTTAFPFGSRLNGDAANCDGTAPYGTKHKGPSRERPTAVGSFPPNPRGMYDLIGNVGEWVRDAFRDDFENLPPVDPVFDLADARRRVFRGGSWDRNPIYCRTAYRNHIPPNARTNNIGFRIVLA